MKLTIPLFVHVKSDNPDSPTYHLHLSDMTSYGYYGVCMEEIEVTVDYPEPTKDERVQKEVCVLRGQIEKIRGEANESIAHLDQKIHRLQALEFTHAGGENK